MRSSSDGLDGPIGLVEALHIYAEDAIVTTLPLLLVVAVAWLWQSFAVAETASTVVGCAEAARTVLRRCRCH